MLVASLSSLFLASNLLNRRSLLLTSCAATPTVFMMSSTNTTTKTLVTGGGGGGGVDKSTDPIRWGIIGLGDVTQTKSGPPFFKCNGAELVAVMRRTPGKAAEWAKRVPGGKCVGYDNLDDFLNHETENGDKLDAVYIATRPGTHLELCQKVASSGKAVYVEKPVGRCAAETLAIVDCMNEKGLPLYTAYISRAYERTQAIRKLLSEGAIGDKVIKVEYNLVGSGGARGMDEDHLPWRLDAKQSGGGLIMDVGCHIIDRIDYLCGPLVDVVGKAINLNSPKQNVEDFVQLQAKIGPSTWASISCEGADVSCVWDFSARSKEQEVDKLVIHGNKGTLEMVGMSPSLPIYLLDYENGNVVSELTFETPEHTAQQMIQAVTDNLRGVSSSSLTSVGSTSDSLLSRGDNAVRTSQVIDKVLYNYYGGREIGYWDRQATWPGRPASVKA